MMSHYKRKVLTVGLTVQEFVQVAPWLDRAEFEVDRLPSARGAHELVSRRLIDALLVRFDMPEGDLDEFIAAVRARASACRHSPLLLLANSKHRAEANSYIGRGANRVMTLNGDHQTMQATICSLLRVAPRQSCRFVAQLDAKIGCDHDWILCRTHNGSTTGVLLESEKRFPTGSKVNFEFMLPAIAQPVLGKAEITRQTFDGHDPVAGMGMRFLSFRGESRHTYEAFLAES